MDFSDLDTSLKVTATNVVLYSAWLYVNRHFITSTPQSQRSSILTTNIGFAQSNPGAIVSFLKKTGLVDSSLAPSSLSKLVAQRHINYEELCLLHLAKESLFLNSASKVNALALLSKYIVYNPYQNIDLNVLRTYDISLSPVPGNVNNNSRTDYFSTLLEGTGLFAFVGARNNGIMQIKPGTLPIFRYLDYCQFADCTLPINSSDRFEYFASTKDGLFDHLLDSKPIIWDTYFPYLNGKILRTRSSHLQQIFYGAPGTGKSHGIQKAEDDFAKVIRTTFHPDSDYSTFVGAYKPVKREQKIYSVNELAALWGSTYPTFPNRPEIRFASIYYKSLIAAGSAQYPNIFVGANTNVVNAEVPKGIAAAESYEKIVGGGEITYDFTPQAFTQAYVNAWKLYAEGKGVLLVIEEINRGNCAQIFGDLFQLLDRRDDGFSCYPIVPDTDLQRFVADQGISVSGVVDARGNDISAEINNGTKLLLPPNLYIWATMNTSDQSLFPIDSAFKRRWDWKYIKIGEGKDDSGARLEWTLSFVDDPDDAAQKLSWWKFIKKLNIIVESMTDSADKQLGYFFCKANAAKEITAEVFVGKVVFYLWNDVFKMCGFDDQQLFTYEKEVDGQKRNTRITFSEFYNEEGEVNAEVAKAFALNVMKWNKAK